MASNLSVLIVHPSLPPYRVDLFNDVSYKIPRLHLFFLKGQMSSQPVAFDEFDVKFDYTIGTERKFKKHRPLFIALCVFPALVRTLIKQKPRVIVTSEFDLLSLVLVLYCRLTGRKHIAWTDDSLDNAMQCGNFRKLRREFVLRLTRGLIVCNPLVRDYFQRRLAYNVEAVEIIQKESVFRRCLHSSISKANEYIAQYDLEGKKVVLFVGRLVSVKNIPALLDAFGHVDDTNARLVLVGSGELEGTLHGLAKRAGLADRIIFAGRQTAENLWAWYLIGSLFVLPSTNERFGAVVNEALLAGMPVLCSKYAGASCLIEDGYNGAVFDPDDVKGFAQVLSGWLRKVPSVNYVETIQTLLMSVRFDDVVAGFIDECTGEDESL